MPPDSRQLSDQGAARGALQAAHEAMADYPAIVAMHEEQTERAEAEVARLRAALEIFADRENWTGHGLAAMEAGPLICGHFDPIELAHEALNGGDQDG